MKRSAYPIKTMSVAALLLLCSSAFLGAFDFGLAAEQEFSAQGNYDNAVIDYTYTAGLVPYFSIPLGNSGDLYISAKVSGVYEREEWFFVPEILHTEFSLRFDNLKIRIGRMPYADPLNFIVEGLFDGAQVLCDTPIGSFNAGAWYTGLLYKKSASIMMTQEDYISYYAPVDYNNFSDTYFASRRLLAAAGWEHPSLAQLIRVRTALTGQFDYNDVNKPYHSAYFSGKAVMPLKRFVFNAGFGICMDTEEIELGYTWETGISWLPPTPLFSQLSLNWRSGHGKFVPVTVKDQGEIL
ncbi:MAG: hypothetical protein LBU82_00650, partial [Treponema sp.]|nr:hypothetical protein [Treponema sp.]